MKQRSRAATWGALVLGYALFVAQGVTAASAPIVVKPLATGHYLLTGAGGNIVFSTGSDGIVMVDTQLFATAPQVEKAIQDTYKAPINYIINTHWYPDHSDGNAYFGKTGMLFAHSSIDKRLAADQKIPLFHKEMKAQPGAGLADITFESAMTLKANGENVRVIHFPSTNMPDGSSIVIFDTAHIAHVGSLYMQGSFPLIDAQGGGSLKGMVASLETIGRMLPEGTSIVGSRGEPADRALFTRYVAMLSQSVDAVRAAKARGLTLDQILQNGLGPAAAEFRGGFVKERDFIKMIYESEKGIL